VSTTTVILTPTPISKQTGHKAPLKAKKTKMQTEVRITNSAPFLKRIRTLFVEVKKTFKAQGFKGLFRVYGWKIVAAFFAYYLVRDVTLYILLPWLVARHFVNS